MILKKEIEHSKIDILNAAALSYSPKLYYLKTKYLLETIGLTFDELFIFLDIYDIQDKVLYGNYIPNPEIIRKPFQSEIKEWIKTVSFLAYSTGFLYQETQLKGKGYFWLKDQDAEFFEDTVFPKIRSDWTTDILFNNRWTQIGLRSAMDDMNCTL